MFPNSGSHPLDTEGLAQRIRGLIGGEAGGNWAAAARRLGVSEVSLAASIARGGPRLNLAVLVAIVQNYGVDPTWLLTGQYDLATHRQAMEQDTLSVADIIRGVLQRGSRASTPGASAPGLSDANW